MRKFMIPLLLSSVMLPAAGSARDGSFIDGIRSKAERSQPSTSSDERPQRERQTDNGGEPPAKPRAERVERVERPARVDRIEQQVERASRAPHVRKLPRAEQDAPIETVRRVQVEQVAPASPVQRSERSGNAVLDGVREQARRDQIGWDGRDRDRRDWSRRDRDGRDWSRRDNDRHDWSRDWRNDRRYDWSRYRSRYGSLYRVGRYYDPYGWGYRRWSVGFNLWPSYYGSSYWLNDPWMYRLPPAYGPYRWIRYYDDALLVNVYTGMVVDVVHNFFW